MVKQHIKDVVGQCIINVQRPSGRETNTVIELKDVAEHIAWHKAHHNLVSVRPVNMFRGVE